MLTTAGLINLMLTLVGDLGVGDDDCRFKPISAGFPQFIILWLSV